MRAVPFFNGLLGHKWSLNAGAEIFQLEIGDFGGYISDMTLTLENDLTEHVGWGVGFNAFRLGVDMEDGNLDADIEYDYQGILLYLRVYF